MRGQVAQGQPAAQRRCGKDARLWLWMGDRCLGARGVVIVEGICWVGLIGRSEAPP